jgi:hypothetical protein
MRRRRRSRAAVALVRARLGRTTAARLGLAGGLAVAFVFAIAIVALRAGDGARAPLDGLLESAAVWIAWVAGAPSALAAASDRRTLDREAGIEALFASRGIPARPLDAVRTAASMMLITRAVGLPLLALAVLAAALSASMAAALGRIGVGLALAVFAFITGVTLGALAAAAGRLGGRRGRLWFAAVVLVPWMLGDLVGHSAWSIPGALGAALRFLVSLAGGNS